MLKIQFVPLLISRSSKYENELIQKKRLLCLKNRTQEHCVYRNVSKSTIQRENYLNRENEDHKSSSIMDSPFVSVVSRREKYFRDRC